jgi:poly(A) polymerase
MARTKIVLMIKKFIQKLLGTTPAASKGTTSRGKRVEVPVKTHGIDPALVDERALKVVSTLTDAGYEAYIVGGAVRDLILGLRPKDFDVATNATPEQVKTQFRRAFIIGRRFRIVHVVFGRGLDHDVIEVSTFRAMLDAQQTEQVQGNERTAKHQLTGKSHAVGSDGRVLRDNVWGNQLEDAARRDFTVNAMYYDPLRQIVVDYHGGIKDVKKKIMRIIGDPETRYREDPVRILRAIRFAAKLGFQIEPATLAPIVSMARLLDNVPQSRLFDEMLKLLQTGHALASVQELRKHQLHQGLFPVLDALFNEDPDAPGRAQFVQLVLQDTDRRVAEGKSVAPSFMLACLLWHDVLERWQQFKRQNTPPTPALQSAVDAVFDERIGDISGRGKLGADMREIWTMQMRFERRIGKGPFSLLEQPRFRAGFDFLRLRAEAGEVPPELARWWEDFSQADDSQRQALIELAREQEQSMRQKTSAPRGETPVTQEEGLAKKRRRRRRKPNEAGNAESDAPE